jgi:8-oxo-dGTP pyrophosphatase MutT (NUDIX family)
MPPPSTPITAEPAPDKSRVEGAMDLGFRVAYRVAHRMFRAWWALRRPATSGALVAVWNDRELLVVKNSYRRHFTLPGGYVRHGESIEQAAARELAEEVGIVVKPAQVREVYAGLEDYEHRRDHVTILEVELDHRPIVTVDNREVVWAGFKPVSEVLAMPVVPHIRRWLRQRAVSPPA